MLIGKCPEIGHLKSNCNVINKFTKIVISLTAAEDFFLNGMTKAISQLAENAHPTFPVTIYYAFKQSETKEENTSNKGWETFLTAVIESGFSIDGTCPIRSEQSSRMIGMGSNALASSVVLVCNKRESKLEPVSRRQFQRELRDEMPRALEIMIGGLTPVKVDSPMLAITVVSRPHTHGYALRA